VARVSALARPAVVASLLLAAAVALHPSLGAAAWMPERDLVVAALLAATAVAFLVRAATASDAERPGAALVALGAALVVGALAYDGVFGHHGRLELGVGEARGHFDESGPGGQSLGLRPLGFSIGVDRVLPDGAVDLAFSNLGGVFPLRPDRAATYGGYRFASPRSAPTGGVARLRVSVSDGTRTSFADVFPGRPGEAAGLEIALEQFFPDFALDERQQPFTRSLEPRNPAALLSVRRGGETHRAFVIQSMPGVHRVEPLGASFALVEVEPERAVEMAVHREPAAPVALAGGLVVALAMLLLAARAWRASAVAVVDPPLVAGAALVLALVLAGGGGVLAWRFSVPAAAGPVPLPAVGVFLGVCLLSSVLGSSLLAAQHAAGKEASVRPLGRLALWIAIGAGAVGVLVGTVQVAAASDVTAASAAPLAGVTLALAVLAGALAVDGGRAGRAAALALPVAVAAAVVLASAVAWRALSASGTYATPAAVAAASAALAGLAAVEPTGLVAARRLAFLLALLTLLVRPL